MNICKMCVSVCVSASVFVCVSICQERFVTQRDLLCVFSAVGTETCGSKRIGTAKGLIIAPIICIITMFF